MIDKLQELINKANAAKRILEDEGVNAILNQIALDWTEEALRACIATPDSSVTLLRQVVTLDVLKSKLQAVVANGREAQRELERMNPT